MKKIGKFFKEHRIFTMLMAIVIVCFVLIMTVLISVFGGIGNDSNKHGSRQEGIVEISDKKQKDIENNIANNDKVKSADIIISVNTIFIRIQIEPGVLLEEAKGIAQKSLDEFNEEELAYYDFQFTLKQSANEKSEGFLIEGSKNAPGTKLEWNYNKPVEKEDASA